MAIILILIIGVCLLLMNTKFSLTRFDLTKGITIFILTWMISLIIYEAGVFTNYPVITYKTWIYLILTIFGATLMYHLAGKINFSYTGSNYDIGKLKLSANIILVFVILSFLYTIIKLGLPPTLGGGVLRDQYYISGVETVYLSIYIAMFLYSYILSKTHSFKGIWIQYIIIFLLVVLKGNKFAFFVFLLTFLFFFAKKVKISQMLTLLVGILGVFILASTLYLNESNEFTLRTAQIYELGYRLPINFAFLIDPFVYFSSNIVNLNTIVNSDFSNWSYGIFSFKIIRQDFAFLFPNTQVTADALNNWIRSILPFPWLNTYSAFGGLYLDFGLVIASILFSVFSFFAGLFDKVRSVGGSSLITLYISFLFYQLLALSFFTFFFSNKEIITNLLIIILVHNFSKNKKVN